MNNYFICLFIIVISLTGCFYNIDNDLSANEIRFLKGLEYFLNGHCQSQNEIIKFIKHCKAFESAEGYLSPTFFKTLIMKKAQFISGPFTNMIFEILEIQKNKLKVLVGNIVTTISDKKNCLYCPI
mgnify:CR=1 FL=1